MTRRLLPVCLLLALVGCWSSHKPGVRAQVPKAASTPAQALATAARATAKNIEDGAAVQRHLADYATVKLTADLSKFDAAQKQMIALLVEADDSTKALYWQQSWGDGPALLQKLSNPANQSPTGSKGP